MRCVAFMVSGTVLWLVVSFGTLPGETGTGAEEEAPPGAVVINEVNYHPASDDPADEWIELYHGGEAAVDLGGWQLAGDVEFTFPRPLRLSPGAFLVVCRDVERVQGSTGLDCAAGSCVYGNWTGRLGRRKGVIRLLDAAGGEVDALAYADRAPFAELADGSGHSLERRSPRRATNDPANWGASTGLAPPAPGAATWRRVTTRGIATSSRLYVHLTEAGVAYIDDLSLRDPSGGPSLVPGGDFEEARVPWVFTGNHARSRVTTESPRSGRRCLRIEASGPGGSSAASAMHMQLRVTQGREYVLEFWIRFDGAPVGVLARLSGAREGNGIYVESGPRRGSTPGRVNSRYSATLPPFVYPVSHRPEEPRPGEAVTVQASISATTDLESVRLRYDAGRGVRSVPLEATKSGTREESRALTNAIYSARLPGFAPGTLVRYWVEAEDAGGGKGRFPFDGSPTGSLGFFVTGDQPSRSNVPVYRLFLSEAALTALSSSPYSDTYQKGTLVYDGKVSCDVGVRRRGHTSRRYPKHHWKIRFNNDHDYRSPAAAYRRVRSINLNSAYGDKTYMREPLGYALWRDLGEAHSGTSFVRVDLNGEHLGLYVQVENPGGDYLNRNGLEKGWLWKAYQSGHGEGRRPIQVSRSSGGFFQRIFGRRPSRNRVDTTRSTVFGGIRGFELKAGDPQRGAVQLERFLRQMNALQGDALESYIREHMDVDSMINFLAASQVIHSADHVEKNYLVYADPEGRFTLLPWDLDLTHGRNYELNGGILNDVIRWDMWDEEHGDDKLLFGTLAHPKVDGPWNAVINAFLGRTTAFRKQYYERVAYCLRHYYHPDILIPRVERIRDLIRADVDLDHRRWGRFTPGDNDFDRRFTLLIDWIRKRYLHLSRKLAALGHPVGPPLSASFEVDRPRGNAPLEVHFENLSVGRIERTTWDFGDGTRSTERAPGHVYTRPGRYDVTLEVTGPDGSHRSLRRECVYVERATGKN